MQCAFSSHDDGVSFSVLLGQVRWSGVVLALQNIVAATYCETEERHLCLVYSPRNTKCLKFSEKYILPPAVEGVTPPRHHLMRGGSRSMAPHILNLLKTKCDPLYVRSQIVPRSKHFSPRL